MAANRLERYSGGLKLDPNFELLAILLALALKEEDAERFLEVYDHVVPKSLSSFEVEGIKDRARELSDLHGGTLLELKAAQESEAAVFSLSSGVSLGRVISRRIDDSRHHRDTDIGQTDHQCQRKFLSKSGALLNQHLNSQTDALGGEGDAFWREEALSHLQDIGEYSRVDTGSQSGISYIRPQEYLLDSEQLLDWQVFPKAHLADDNLLATGDNNSSVAQNQWSTMESATAHNKVQRAQTSNVKQHKKLFQPKNSTPFVQEQQVLMNGTVDNVKSRTSNCTDKDKQCIKSKPPQTDATPSLNNSKTISQKTNCLLSHVENSYFDDICELDDYTKEEKEALIPKSPPVPDSPPFKSFEEVGHSVRELLTNNQPKNSTCPPPLFLSKTTTTLAYPNSMDGSMAAKAETKYGTLTYSVDKDNIHKHKKTTPPKIDAVLNHQLPDNIAEDSTNVKSNSFSTPEVPLHVNRSAVNVCSSGGEASDHMDKEEFNGAADEQPQNIAVQWNAEKKKKKKNKKKKTAGTGIETINANNMKLPVGAPPLPQSPPDFHHKHQPKNSQSLRSHTGAISKLTNEYSIDISRHPPPMLSSDSVTSSGESSTDGGACMNDVGSQQHGAPGKKDAALNFANSHNNTNQTLNTNNTAGAMDEGRAVLNRMKDIHTQENPPTNKLQPLNTTSKADRHLTADIQPHNRSLSKTTSQPLNQGLTVKSDPSDSDSDRNEAKKHVVKAMVSERPSTVGKPHSLSEPTASADSSADNDDNSDFIKVEYKRTKKRGGGIVDDHRFAPPQGRYMYIDRDRDYFRNRNMLSAGLRKSSSEPTGMSELGDKENEDIDTSKTKPKNLSDSLTKMDTNVMSSVQTEPTTVPRSEFSYASKVKLNMKTSSLPPKLSPQALLDYVDDDHSDNPANSENSPESMTGNKSMALESKALPSGKSVLDKNDPSVVQKGEFIAAHTAKEQLIINNIRPERHYNVSQIMKPPDNSNKLGQGRSFVRSSSVDTSEVTKKVSFDDNSIRRTIPPQGPEASVQYLDLTYAGRLKGPRPAIAKSTAVNQTPLSSDAQQARVSGLKDLKSRPLRLKPHEKEVLVTSKASIVLATNPSSTPNDPSSGNVTTKPIRSDPISSVDFKPVDQPTISGPRAAVAPLPPTLSRNTTSSPTPSGGSSTSRPYPMFDLEPQDNFDITFGSVIVGKVGYEILGEDNSAAQRGNPVKELMSKLQMTGRVLMPPGLSCAELEQSFMRQDSTLSTNVKVDDVMGGETSAASGVSFGKFDGAWGINAALKEKADCVGNFNHLEVAEMLLAEWHKTQEEIGQNKVLIIA